MSETTRNKIYTLYVRVASEYCSEFGPPSRDQARRYREADRAVPAGHGQPAHKRPQQLIRLRGHPEHRVRCAKVQRRSYLEDAIGAQDCRRKTAFEQRAVVEEVVAW